jgi:hypothetical protein
MKPTLDMFLKFKGVTATLTKNKIVSQEYFIVDDNGDGSYTLSSEDGGGNSNSIIRINGNCSFGPIFGGSSTSYINNKKIQVIGNKTYINDRLVDDGTGSGEERKRDPRAIQEWVLPDGQIIGLNITFGLFKALSNDRFGPMVNISVTGSGTLELDGSYQNINACVSGSGDIYLDKVDIVTATVNGSGDINMHVKQSGTCIVNGSGDIRGTKDPVACIKKMVNGSGRVRIR